MKENTTNGQFYDEVEVARIDKFVCAEMQRQIHRYIKAMKGSKSMMELFEESLATLSIPEREKAIAKYIDLNRKVISGLDWKIVLTRAMANYCDTFAYLLTLVNDRRKMIFYLNRVKDKYVRFHEVFEENGKFGIKDHSGNIIIPAEYDFLRSPYVYVDDLRTMPVIAEKNGKLGLISNDGKNTVVADFIYDDIALRDQPPYFEVKKGRKKYLMNYKGEIAA
jgi:hypothetical protein